MKTSRLLRQEPHRLSNGLREILLQQGKGKGLLVVESLYTLKFNNDTWLTFSEIYRLIHNNFGTAYGLVYEGLRESLIFLRRRRSPQPGQRGRPAYEYRIPHPDELAVEFAPDLHDTPSDPLNHCDLQTLTSYRMALHRQLYIRKWCENGGKGFVMCRGLMADRLGVSVRTIRTYDTKLCFSHEENYHEQSVTWENLHRLPRYKKDRSPTGERLASREWLRIYDWETGKYDSAPLVKYMAYNGLRAGLSVKRVRRLPNTYFPYQKPSESDYDPSDPVDRYLVEMGARQAAGLYERNGAWHYQRE